jgi:hypothetical protein
VSNHTKFKLIVSVFFDLRQRNVQLLYQPIQTPSLYTQNLRSGWPASQLRTSKKTPLKKIPAFFYSRSGHT